MNDIETKVVQDRKHAKKEAKAAAPSTPHGYKAKRAKKHPSLAVKRYDSGRRMGEKMMNVERGTARRLRREDCAYYVLSRDDEGNPTANRYGRRDGCPKGSKIYYVKDAEAALAAARSN